MERNCDNCALNTPVVKKHGCMSCDQSLSNFVPKQPAREPQEELVTVPLILPIDLRKKVDALAAQCGLTSEQIASAMIVLAFKNIEPVEPEPPKPATIPINGVEVKAPKSSTVMLDGHVLTLSSDAVVSYFDCHDDALAMKAAFDGKKP